MIALMMSKKTFDKLPPELQKAVREAGKTALGGQRVAAGANAKSLVGALEKKGMKVNTVTDVTPFRNSVKPMYEKFKPSIGADTLNAVLAGVE